MGKFKVAMAVCLSMVLGIAQGQLCNGSLGNPVVNIDFGSGSSVHAGALASGLTSYSYSTADFPYDGSYTVENSTAGSGSVWWSTKDHTGNTGGYMMVVNASISTTDYFYKKTVSGLCGSTTYEFAAWVVNLLRSRDISPPNITFTIETTSGTILNSYNTGAIGLTSSPVWRQYGFYFTTPPNTTDVVIRMRNNSAGGAPANDLALDDITFRPCGPDVTATINGSSSAQVCEEQNSTVVLKAAMAGGYTNPAYQWQVNSGSGWQNVAGATAIESVVAVDALSTGMVYQYRVLVGEGSASITCSVLSNIVTLTVQALPVANYGLFSVACAGRAVQFIDSSTVGKAATYLWTFGDGQTGTGYNPYHVYADTGTYITGLIVTSGIGCTDTATNVAVPVYGLPTAGITATPADTTIFEPNVTITDLSTGTVSCKIYWDDGDEGDCSERTHTYRRAGTYTIMQVVTNSDGCTDTAWATIVKEPEYRLFIPNVFTPNGDGNNDVFKPNYLGVFSYTLQIFNRWGEKVFESENVDEGWDGTYKDNSQMPGVYIYNLLFRDEKSLEWHSYKGSVTLLK